jgi:hypothetical protein
MNFLDNPFNNKFEEGESSDYFFHFTNKIDHLISIMNDNFMPFYCMESIDYLDLPSSNNIGIAFPMVCFCDLPISRHSEYRKKYGEYGIGLKKNWGISNDENHLTPVIYSHRKSISSANLMYFIEESKRYEINMTKEEIQVFKNNVSLLMMHFKPYSAFCYNKEDKRFSNNEIRFYDEKEWRYIPLNTDGLKLSLDYNEYMDVEELNEANRKIQKNNKLKFEIDDVSFIFLSDKSDESKFLLEISKNYSEQNIEKIRSKIFWRDKIVVDSDKNSFRFLSKKLADEITRMRQRIAFMPSDLIGISQLLKSLDRLEEELNLLGFELPVLLNQPYNEGMTIQARFIPSESFKTGENIITKVIKPQINYNGHLIQVAEVEVSIGNKN